MPLDLAENYLGAINGALNNPNMASDLKIPGAQQYSGVVLDTELARYLAGEITVDEALANIEDGWEKITEDFGRDEQIKGSGLALGLRASEPGRNAPLKRYQPAGLTGPAGFLAGESWGEWLDRQSRTFFIMPAVVADPGLCDFPDIRFHRLRIEPGQAVR